MKEDENCFVLRTNICRRFGPDIQGEAIFVLGIIVMSCKLIVHSEAIAREIGERGDWGDICWAVTVRRRQRVPK